MIIRNITLTLFGDFQEYDVDAQKISLILSKFMEKRLNLIPGTFQQFNPQIGMRAFERMMFSNSQENIAVEIGLDELRIKKLILDKKHYNVTEQTQEFIRNAKKIITALDEVQISKLRGRRIALMVDGVHDTELGVPLNKVYKTFNNTLPNYDESDQIIEWNTRTAKRYSVDLKGEAEDLNVITEVSRVSGEYDQSGKVSTFDSIQTKMDINTVAERKTLRIDPDFTSNFLDTAIDMFTRNYDEIEVKINGEN